MHDLEIKQDGTAKFAYAGQIPWHRLGKRMHGLQTVDAMLQAAEADFSVHLTKVAAVDAEGNFILDNNGKPVIIDDARATIRQNDDGSFTPFAIVGTRYQVRQNREILERALAVVGASKGDAVIDTCGVLRGGARFFSTIDLGTLVIDPAGVNDVIARYLVVSTGHDGLWPIRYANTDIRAVCNNTVIMGLRDAERVFTARHTPNVDNAIDDAQTVLKISTQWAEGFKRSAEELLKIEIKPGSGKMDKVLNRVFVEPPNESDLLRQRRQQTITLVRAIYNNHKNVGKVGNNGWALYNAIVEYADHHRKSDSYDRAIASMDDASAVTKMKIEAHRAVLALA